MMSQCAYCGQRAVHKDHLIKRAAARRRAEAAYHRKDGDLIVAACMTCNVSIGTRCFVPPSHAHRIPELEAWTMQRYAVFDGDPATLRETIR